MQPTTQIIVVAIIMTIIIILVLLIYLWRWRIFGPRNLNKYGTLTEPIVGQCLIPNKTTQEARCTDVGTQSQVVYCKPNPETGYFCWDGEKQTINSKVTVIECTPTCNTFLWDEPTSTPCLINLSDPGVFPASYIDPIDNWCVPANLLGTQFNTWECNAHDGSGPNACVFTCGAGVDNADCTVPPNNFVSSGAQIIYSPINAINNNNVPPPTQLVNNNGNWTYTPISSAIPNTFPVIPSTQMVTAQPCTNFSGFKCGEWVNPNPDRNLTILPTCVPYSNLTTSLNPIITPNNVNMLYESGILLNDTICENSSTSGTISNSQSTLTATRCLPDANNCISRNQIINPNGVVTPFYKNLIPPDLPNICAEFTTDINGHITAVTEPQKAINSCLYMDPNLSLTWVGASNFDYYDSSDVFNPFKGIVSVPLLVSNVNGYLTLYNTPCPNFTSVNNSGNISYNFTDGANGFIDNRIAQPPVSGIPFRFDCKGSITNNLQRTPCAWAVNPPNPSIFWGLTSDCNVNSNLLSNPVVEQSSLFLFIKPINIAGNQLRCNILTVLQNNYTGWLTYNNSTSLSGYTWGSGSIFPNSSILVWNQARFDPFSTALIPGTTVANLGVSAEFIIVQTGTPLNPVYTILTGTNNPVYTIGTNNTGSNIISMTNLIFTASTVNSQSIASSTSASTVTIDSTLLNESLFSRSNRNTYPTPMCNILIGLD